MNEETKKKISAAQRLAWQQRKKRSMAMKAGWARRRARLTGKTPCDPLPQKAEAPFEIKENKSYVIAVHISGESKKELLQQVRELARQIRETVE